jgi:DNA-binding transcriptional ArsR family regulator
MDITLDRAAPVFAQLGNETRLAIVRLLVRAADTGLTVGEIQRSLAIPGSTLSHHLQQLRAAGLMAQRREGSTLRCQVDIALLQSVSAFLVTECCAGVRPSDTSNAA